jgi:hypothetical protein
MASASAAAKSALSLRLSRVAATGRAMMDKQMNATQREKKSMTVRGVQDKKRRQNPNN